MSVWVGIDWDDPGKPGQEAAQFSAVPRQGETVIAMDGSRWTVTAVEWPIARHAVIRLRPEQVS